MQLEEKITFNVSLNTMQQVDVGTEIYVGSILRVA